MNEVELRMRLSALKRNEVVEKVARNAWKKHVEGELRYEDLKPEGKLRFVAAIRYAMREAIKMKDLKR